MATTPDPSIARCGAAPKPGRPRTTPCRKWPVTGSNRCRLHGGVGEYQRQRAAAQKLEQRVQKAVKSLGIEPIADPLQALSRMAAEIIAWKDVMAEHVQHLMDADTLRYRGGDTEQIRGEIVLFERALDRCVAVLAAIAKLGIEDRLAAVTERQADMLESALFAAFDAAGLTLSDADLKEKVATEFSRHLQLVS